MAFLSGFSFEVFSKYLRPFNISLASEDALNAVILAIRSKLKRREDEN